MAFTLATRGSRLALIQTAEAARAISRLLPDVRMVTQRHSSPGDRDTATDLRLSAPDFFTRDLHAAVLNGTADGAVHSAKDLEDSPPPGIDWFWLPTSADPRDVWVMRPGETREALRADGVAGVSSHRREAYCRKAFPRMRTASIRGTIEERLARLDRGDYDLLIMAGAALQRLGLDNRISGWISTDDLPPPEGQGHLAITFRAGDERWLRIRSLFVMPVIFAGAGCGTAETCTRAVWTALARADVCLHDSLLDAELLHQLPRRAQCVDVGKRCGSHAVSQSEINAQIASAARRGRRVVRLKGGDPGIFGRLSEEIGVLDALHLPYRVLPGVSSLMAATTGTGMLLTQRGVSPGFTVMTPRRQDGAVGSVQAAARNEWPLVIFMGVGVLPELVEQLTADGLTPATPIALVFDAGSPDETVIRGTLADIVEHATGPITEHRLSQAPGLIIVGAPAAHGYHREWGALGGVRVLLPGSDALQQKAIHAVQDLGGIPVPLPLIRMEPEAGCAPVLATLTGFAWLVVTSPTAVHLLMRRLADEAIDVRRLPKILVAGPGTADAFSIYGIVPEIVPEAQFGAEGVIEAATRSIPAGATVLRVRSRAAGTDLTEALIRAGFDVTDCVLYDAIPTRPDHIPDCDAVVFASASAVVAYAAQRPPHTLDGKTVVAIGPPTLAALARHGVRGAYVAVEATVESAVMKLATVRCGERLASVAKESANERIS
jgi:uroporphyrinogen III methyltransferase/synthase